LGKITLKLSAVTVVNTEERSFMSLTEIRNKHCKECPLHEKAHTVCVMGTGSFHKPFFVVGEAPGYQEDQMGRPFVGRSGKLLRSELIRAGVNLEKGYVTNTVKCFPDGTPTDDQTRICSHLYLRREIEEMKPQWILTVGTPAFKALTNSKETITNARGQVWEPRFGEGLVFPTFHPAYILYNRKELPTFQGDLEMFAAMIDY
jgi:uracil-DNA glycosylase